jgi:DNA-binding NtrC family response regulator
MPQQPTTISITSAKEHMHDDYEIQDTEEYVEEVMSLENAEKELIRKALIRSRGRRKVAAQELKISERTLYRKIKEYNLEEY